MSRGFKSKIRKNNKRMKNETLHPMDKIVAYFALLPYYKVVENESVEFYIPNKTKKYKASSGMSKTTTEVLKDQVFFMLMQDLLNL